MKHTVYSMSDIIGLASHQNKGYADAVIQSALTGVLDATSDELDPFFLIFHSLISGANHQETDMKASGAIEEKKNEDADDEFAFYCVSKILFDGGSTTGDRGGLFPIIFLHVTTNASFTIACLQHVAELASSYKIVRKVLSSVAPEKWNWIFVRIIL